MRRVPDLEMLADSARSLATRRDAGRLEVPEPLLVEMLETGRVQNRDGATIDLVANISAEHATALYRTVVGEAPTTMVEIGMAHGASSLAILAALRELGGPRQLISIDPWQHRFYEGVGQSAAERAGLSHLHLLIEQPDHLALPDLLAAGTKVDMAYIDGMHTFDRTLLDFFYLDKMMPVGGVVAFNDCAMPSVYHVTKFVSRHRKFESIDVGLPKRYLSSSPTRSLGRWVLRRPKTDRYFRKIESWEPTSTFWTRF